jgi:hypothetical protein
MRSAHYPEQDQRHTNKNAIQTARNLHTSFLPAAAATSNLTNKKQGGNSAKAGAVVSEHPFAP